MPEDQVSTETPPNEKPDVVDSSGNVTKLALRADMTVDDKPVAIEAVLGGDFFLQLSEPASLGTPISFAYWLRDVYKVENGLDLMLPYETKAEFATEFAKYKANKATSQLESSIQAKFTDIPDSAKKLLQTALLAELTITELLIDVKAKTENAAETKRSKFGLSVTFNDTLSLLPGIDVNKLSFLIMNFPEADKDKKNFGFPERVNLPRPEPLAIKPKDDPENPVEPVVVEKKATGKITFTANPTDGQTITLGGEVWTFAAKTAGADKKVKIGDTLAQTMTTLLDALRASKAGPTTKCDYAVKDDGVAQKVLVVTYKTLEVEGNDFTLAASPPAVASDGKLSGAEPLA